MTPGCRLREYRIERVLGQLGRTFNVMVDVLRQREKERRRDGA